MLNCNSIESSEILKENGLITNVASVPCIEELEKNESSYKKIFSQDSINIVIECSHPNSWYKHTKNVIGIETFGESGKGNQLMDHFGFTPSKIAKKISELV